MPLHGCDVPQLEMKQNIVVLNLCFKDTTKKCYTQKFYLFLFQSSYNQQCI